MKNKISVNLGLMGLVFSLFFTATVSAQEYVVVTPADQQGWSDAASTDGGSVEFVTDDDAPRGVGALELSTDDSTTAKANYSLVMEPVAFGDITDLSYFNKTVAASFPQGAASYQLSVCLEGVEGETCNGFTTLVFEPYWNVDQGPVVFGEWQEWDVDEGELWSTRTYTGEGTCAVTAGAGGPPFYTIDGLTTTCPDAEVFAIAVNVGSNNPDYVTRVDLVQFNDTIYDFEPYIVPTEMGQCRGMGWTTVYMADGTPFRNQGLCIAYVVRNNPPGERRGQQ